jgi:hypothetical protein
MIWKEVVMVQTRQYSGICLEALRKSMKTLRLHGAQSKSECQVHEVTDYLLWVRNTIKLYVLAL